MAGATDSQVDQLVPGESLVVYTDGLIDALAPGGELFGKERLTAVLQEHRDANPEEMLAHVDRSVSEHTAPGRPDDDINIIVLQYPER
jgi:sigma-B regulation protein RsbU (phosphoserine phosphatase)